MKSLDRVRSGFLRFIGYLIPLVQSLPSIGVYAGLMTLPFASYLVLVFSSFPESVVSISEFFFWSQPYLVAERVFIIVGFLILVFSVVYLWVKRKEGLVTSGPYRLVRHPQYLGIILLTLGLTSLSVWILNTSYGIGFLNPSQTISVWFIELLAYIFLAHVEELFLSRNYGEAFEEYKKKLLFLYLFPRLIGNT